MAGQAGTREREWKSATRAALLALGVNFPAQKIGEFEDADQWGVLTSKSFPCQKSDNLSRCPGWALTGSVEMAVPGDARPCPCLMGRHLHFGHILEIAKEFRESEEFGGHAMSKSLAAYSVAANSPEMLSILMDWMWMAAVGSFKPLQEGHWLAPASRTSLGPEQLQTLRWWVRLVELSGLVSNESFTLILRSSVEKLYKSGQLAALHSMVDQLESQSEPLIVLALNGSELSPAGFHSERNAWLEGLLSIVDERCFGLCIIAKQPLFAVEKSRIAEKTTEYRWKTGGSRNHLPFGLQDVLRRGAWDRLCEALARGEMLSAKIKVY